MSNKTCFVISQIGSKESPERKHADQVLKHIIKPALEPDFDVTRADQIYHSDKIDDKIFEQLQQADLVIADLTGSNLNVFLEVGYRMALDKPTIYLIQEIDGKSLPFDIQSINIIHYDIKNSETILDSASETTETIIKTVRQLSFNDSSLPKKQTSNDELKTILLNLSDDIENISNQISQEPPTQNMNDKMFELMWEDPDKLEKIAHIIEKFPALVPPQQ